MNQEQRDEHFEKMGATFFRILRQTTIRALLKSSGKQPLDLSEAEGDALIDPFRQALAADQLMCLEVARQFYTLGFAQGARPEAPGEPDGAGEPLGGVPPPPTWSAGPIRYTAPAERLAT